VNKHRGRLPTECSICPVHYVPFKHLLFSVLGMVLLSQAHTLTLQNEELTALHSLSSVQAPPIPAIKCRKL